MKTKSLLIHLDLKPLSVNAAYRGRRFATKELVKYKTDVCRLLPRMIIPKKTKLAVRYIFGVSAATDGDNAIKAFQDALAERYVFNDKLIYEWHITKIAVPKGEEF